MHRIPPALPLSRVRPCPRTLASIAVPILLTALAAVLVLAPSASADWISPESGGSPNADKIDSLYWATMIIAIVIFVGVEGLLFYTLWKFRASKGAVAKQVRGNDTLERIWTIGAAVIVIFLAVYTFFQLDEITDPPKSIASGVEPDAAPLTDKGDLNICVDGFQFGWRYIYQQKCTSTHRGTDNARRPGKNVGLYAFEEMVVPAGVTVRLQISSLDVNHAWWIPKLGGKRDATRGYLIETWFRVPEKFGEQPGGTVFFGQCAELCGRNHANMTARVRAVSIAEFNRWAKQQRADIAAGNATLPGLRKQLKVTQ